MGTLVANIFQSFGGGFGFIDGYSEKDNDGNVDHEGLNVSRIYCKAKHSAFKRAKRLLKWDKLSIHDFFTNDDFQPCTVWMIEIAYFSVHILLLHHYKSDLAHISDFDSLVIGISKSER